VRLSFQAGALLLEKSVRLHASCHDQYWTATYIEREQLRKHIVHGNIAAAIRLHHNCSAGPNCNPQ
jgi:hypothetical protein